MTTLITGATGHIGRAVAKRFVSAGKSVLLTGRSAEKLDAVLAECEGLGANGVRVAGVTADLTTGEGVQAVVRHVVEEKHVVQNLIHVAGVNVDKILLRTNDSVIKDVLDTNLVANIQLTREISKLMIKNNKLISSSITNVGSIVSHGNIGQSVYSASKAALSGLTRSLAKEFGSRNIRVNLVEPGFIGDTDMIENVNIEEVTKTIPLRRLGTGDDVAQLCLFLSDAEKSAYITGQTIRVDGGIAV